MQTQINGTSYRTQMLLQIPKNHLHTSIQIVRKSISVLATLKTRTTKAVESHKDATEEYFCSSTSHKKEAHESYSSWRIKEEVRQGTKESGNTLTRYLWSRTPLHIGRQLIITCKQTALRNGHRIKLHRQWTCHQQVQKFSLIFFWVCQLLRIYLINLHRANCINVHSNSSSLLLSFVQDHYQLLPLFNFSLQKSSRSSHHTQRHLPEKKKKAKYIYFALNSGVWGRLGMVRRKYNGKYFLLCAGIAEGMESTHSTAQHMQFRDRKLKK